MKSESGQAAIEWVGLVLVVALALGALVVFVPAAGGGDRGLGHALTSTIVCAARGRCDATRRAGAEARPVAVSISPGGLPPGVVPRGTPGPRRPGTTPPVSPRRAAAAMHVLRGVTRVARRAWIACLGWERYRYERRSPEAAIPGHRMPVGEALRIAHVCLNPAAFVTEGEDP